MISQLSAHVYSICGGRKIEQSKQNNEAFGLNLSAQVITEIDLAVDFDVGLSTSVLFKFGSGKCVVDQTSEDMGLLAYAGNSEVQPHQQPVKPHGLQGYGRNE